MKIRQFMKVVHTDPYRVTRAECKVMIDIEKGCYIYKRFMYDYINRRRMKL